MGYFKEKVKNMKIGSGKFLKIFGQLFQLGLSCNIENPNQ